MNRSLIFLFALATGLFGQTTAPTSSPPSPAVDGDAQWNVVKTFGRQPTLPPSSGNGAAKPTRAEQSRNFISQADQLKAFYTAYPSHPSAKEAKRLETLALSHAALAGDTSQESRRLQLIETVRRDEALPPLSRFEAVAWSRQVEVSRQSLATDAARLSAQEAATRQMIAEFPNLPEGYESLLAVARDAGPVRGPAILNDLRQMPTTGQVQMEVQTLLDRYALVGAALGPMLMKTGFAGLAQRTQGKAIILYAWSYNNPASIAAAKRLAKLAPRAAVIGVNLDPNAEEARRAASEKRLPGDQWADGNGPGNPIAVLLKMNRAPLVYLVDQAGAIRDINALVGTSSKLTALGL
jgi:hypothetical protein